MSHIVVEREEGSFVDRFRPYRVYIDGVFRGLIRQKERWAYAVEPGTHNVSFRIDYYHSPALRVAVVNRTRLVCRSSAAHAFGLLAVFSPGSWIRVVEEGDTAPIDMYYSGEIAPAATAPEPGSKPALNKLFGGRLTKRIAKVAREPAYRLASARTDAATQARRLLELDLRQAVATMAFDVQYEPQIDLRTQRVTGFEVLLRWRHPVRGLVPPVAFVPIAEELGLMGTIGQFVLGQACAEAATWPDQIGLSINVSGRQLADQAMPGIVGAALKAANLPPSRLELEVPEPVAMEHSAAVLASFASLRQTGVRIGIDGFGPAYAAHRQVPETPFDKIKINRSVIKEVSENQGQAAIFRAAIALCASRGMISCAVGVETQEQLAILVDEGCTQAQGRVFGPPLTAREIPAFLARLNGGEAESAQAGARAQGAVSFFQLVESANDAVIVTTAEIDAPGPTIVYVNPAFTRLTGYEPREVLGLTPRILQGPGTSRATLDRIRSGLAAGTAVSETVMNFAKNGAPYWLDLRIVPMRDAVGAITHFAAIQRDVTQDKWRQDDIGHLAERDALTGLPNGAVLTRAVESEIARVQALPAATGPCVVFIGIDDFAALTAKAGEAVGHAVLHGVADRLAENARRCDALCHISGGIFALCMRAVTDIDAQAIVANLCRAVAASAFATPAGPVAVKTSVGLVALTQGETAAALIHRADDALRAVKSSRLPLPELAAD